MVFAPTTPTPYTPPVINRSSTGKWKWWGCGAVRCIDALLTNQFDYNIRLLSTFTSLRRGYEAQLQAKQNFVWYEYFVANDSEISGSECVL